MKRLGIALASALLLATTACTVPAASTQGNDQPPTESQPSAPNTDPRKGKVVVQEYSHYDQLSTWIVKICDGTTLVYYMFMGKAGGLSAVPNSPECQPS